MSLCKEEENGEPGHLLACLVEKREQTKSLQCGDFLFQLESIVFSDYRIISKFADHCQADIGKLECGKARAGAGHSQGRVVACLSARLPELSPACSKEMSWLAELQVKTRLSSTYRTCIPHNVAGRGLAAGLGAARRLPGERAGALRGDGAATRLPLSPLTEGTVVLSCYSGVTFVCYAPSSSSPWNGRDMR